MEDILASIKRIIADDGLAVPAPAAARMHHSPDPASSILELTEPAPPVAKPTQRPVADPVGRAEAAVPDDEEEPATLVSDSAAIASRQSLAALTAMMARPQPAQSNSLEDLVTEMLRPMLKDWLDAHLPELVESMVAREIARITGGSF